MKKEDKQKAMNTIKETMKELSAKDYFFNSKILSKALDEFIEEGKITKYRNILNKFKSNVKKLKKEVQNDIKDLSKEIENKRTKKDKLKEKGK